MNTKMKIQILLGASVIGGSIFGNTGGDFRSPLSLRRSYIHWQLDPVDTTWWYEAMGLEPRDRAWFVESWSSIFYRSAQQSFLKNNNGVINPNNRNKVTTETTTIAPIIFDQIVFRGEDAFPGGILILQNLPVAQQFQLNQNPYLGFARIAPSWEYEEWGAFWGVRGQYDFGCEGNWHVGGRLALPFKVVEIEEAEGQIEETLDDVFSAIPIAIDVDDPSDLDPDMTIRFDLLSSLLASTGQIAPSTVMPLITYGDGSGGDANETRIINNTLTALTANDNAGVPPIYVTRSVSGDIPEYPYRKQASMVAGALAADGSGGADGATLFLKAATDYLDGLGSDRAAQGQLYLVLRAIDTDFDEFAVQTNIIKQLILFRIQLLLRGSTNSAVEFFNEQGVFLNQNERISGVGDMDGEIYFGYGHEYDWFGDLVVGVKFPTGTKTKNENAGNVLSMETGNNRHWELNVGLEGGWQPCDFFAFEIGGRYYHAFGRNQLLSAPFVGATVRNLGPFNTEGSVSWNYGTVYADFTFFHPHSPELGAVIGYELFAKSRDHVKLDATTATTYYGQTAQPIDNTILQANTNALLNKIQGELFYRANFFEFYFGGYQAVSGRNAMKETEAHLGFNVYF